MDFEFTQDQGMLRDTVRKWAARDYAFDRHRAIVREGGFSAQAWRELTDLGLLGMAVPEAHGGLGLGPVDAMVVMEELGRGLVLEPYAHVALVATSLLRDHAGDAVKQAVLPGIADGSLKVVLAHVEHNARYVLTHIEADANPAGQQWTVSGTKSVVPLGDQADAFIVPAQDDDGGTALFLIERSASGVSTRGYQMQDGARAAEVSFKDAPATLLVSQVHGQAALERAVDIGIAAVCAEAVGAMDALFAMTIDYMNTRKQFGVPIGSFQALRHRVADVKMQLELARSMSYFASLKLGEDAATRRHALSAAKVQIGNSLRFVGQQCIQLHGGIGVTDEYAAGHYFKRLTCIEMSFGDTLHHLGEVASRMHSTAGVFA